MQQSNSTLQQPAQTVYHQGHSARQVCHSGTAQSEDLSAALYVLSEDIATFGTSKHEHTEIIGCKARTSPPLSSFRGFKF